MSGHKKRLFALKLLICLMCFPVGNDDVPYSVFTKRLRDPFSLL